MFSVIALYAACAWVVIEVGDLVIDSGMITALTTRDLLVLAIIGFPLALIAGWFYDITRDGVVRTAPAEADESFDGALRPRDYGLLVLLLGAWLAVYLAVPAPHPGTLAAEDSGAQKTVTEKSIAILPFESRGDTDSTHLAFGIQDDLIVHLGRVRDMTLIAQSSVSQIEPGTPDDAVAAKLGVAYVMHGTVERLLNQIRVNVMLIDVAGNRLAWSNQFDRELTMANLFDIRKEIALSVTEELRAVVSPEEAERVIGRMPTDNMMAWQLYLRGRQLFDRRTKEDLERSLQLYRQAIELDPELALAWVGIADSARVMSLALYMDLDEGTDIMRDALDRALALDGQLGEAYASLSVVYKREGLAEKREEACRKSLALSPNYALGHLWCMDVWQRQSDGPEDRLDARYRLAKMDPLSDIHQLNIALALWDQERTDEARQQFERVVNVFPENFHGYRWYGRLEIETGNLAHGVELFRRALELNPEYLHTLVDLFYAYLALGELDQASATAEAALKHPAAAGRADVLAVEVEMQFDLFRGDWAAA
ncbi:MAG: tetratricopeptide repeat protein, partial [Planctomycetes bacterium]|nr:tetratricopeptide repeat protein [Planctomycetota bacterium]